MDEVKVMDEQQRNESLNRHVELDTTQFIVAQLGGEQYGIDIRSEERRVGKECRL